MLAYSPDILIIFKALFWKLEADENIVSKLLYFKG
jgi:hypothetical protein